MLPHNDYFILAKIFQPETELLVHLHPTEVCQLPDGKMPVLNFHSTESFIKFNKKNTKKIVAINHLSHSDEFKAIDFPVFHFVPTKTPTQSFSYINNPDKTIRWIFPSENRYPVFLGLYNGSGWRGWLFRQIFKRAFQLGLKNQVASGQFFLQNAPEYFKYKKERELAIFTGTKGDNRKAVLARQSGEDISHFTKMPLTKSANKIVAQEGKILKRLQQYSFEKMTFPVAEITKEGLQQKNIRPEKILPGDNFSDLHLEVLNELFYNTKTSFPYSNLPAAKEIRTNLEQLSKITPVNNLNKNDINFIYKKLNRLEDDLLKNTEPIPLCLAHGDFTPWNMYVTQDKIAVYDWELAEDLPLLFDAFHHIFQTHILVKRSSTEIILQQINALSANGLVQKMLQETQGDFQILFKFYLLKNISYYTVRYTQQNPLHAQAHWLIQTWKEVLERFTSD